MTALMRTDVFCAAALSVAGALAAGCSKPSHAMKVLKLSKRESICTAARASLLSQDQGIDFVFGVIEADGGETIHYYVGADPGQLGEGRLIHSSPKASVSVAGHDVFENTYADGIKALQVNGFTNHLGGWPNVQVQYFFSPFSESQVELAEKLASATFACQRPNKSFKPNPLRGSA